MDPRRGLYSYPALQGRLSENRFLKDGLADYSGPVLRLSNLTQEELFILLKTLFTSTQMVTLVHTCCQSKV